MTNEAELFQIFITHITHLNAMFDIQNYYIIFSIDFLNNLSRKRFIFANYNSELNIENLVEKVWFKRQAKSKR